MIQGKLVKLRAVEREDLRKITTLMNEPEIAIPLGAHYFGINLREEENWYEGYLNSQYQISSFSIEDLQTGEHIGNAGFGSISWKNRKGTVGIFLDKKYWNGGYGTDVMMTLCHYGFTHLNLQRIQLFVYATNKRGIRCYEKCGFQMEVVQRENSYVNGEYLDDLIMGLLVEEFLPIYEKYMGVSESECGFGRDK